MAKSGRLELGDNLFTDNIDLYSTTATYLAMQQLNNSNQLPSLCDFSRCAVSWSGRVKRSEQCLHEYGFVPV